MFGFVVGALSLFGLVKALRAGRGYGRMGACGGGWARGGPGWDGGRGRWRGPGWGGPGWDGPGGGPGDDPGGAPDGRPGGVPRGGPEGDAPRHAGWGHHHRWGHHHQGWGQSWTQGRHPARDRFALRWLFERLDTTPGQEKVLRQALEEVRAAGANGKSELDAGRREIAAAIRNGVIDETQMAELYARQDEQLRALRTTLFGALAKVTEALDEDQRRALAELIDREGPAFFGGPYRT